VIIGGFGSDTIQGGQGNDVILGDLGVVQYVSAVTGDPASEQVIAQFGFGGRGDVIDAAGATLGTPLVDPRWVYSRDLTVGANDTIYGNGGEDVLIGGAGNDAIDGGSGDDLIFGDAVQLLRRDINPNALGDITNPRFQALTGTEIYSTADATLGQAQNNGVAQNYRDANGSYAPTWSEYVIATLYQSYALQAANDNSWGSDYIAGGPGDDMIFGQLGNDVIQGDGSIDLAHTADSLSCTSGTVGAANWAFAQLVGACRDATNTLQLHASADNYAGTDGSDYIEGGGGSDVIFGNQGQDDIVGGSSDMFSLTNTCTAANEVASAAGTCRRPDLPNMIFGGSGTDIARNDPGPSDPTANAHDSDTIVANNGDIVRLVGTNGAGSGGFLQFAYDSYSATEHIVPRAVTLLDYTPGGPDLAGLTAGCTSSTTCTPIVPGDIGAGAIVNGQAIGSEIHGENGDDFVYGGPANDVIYGDAQNDTLIGGYGNDWISGGTGDDGVLGDDGRILVSRNGTAEPLYGIAAVPAGETADQFISTPGTMQQATINVSSALLYTAMLAPDNLDPSGAVPDTTTPRPVYANDVIYGGLGNDALHGGAGDDAMSGAEAPGIPSYANNYNIDGSLLAAHVQSDFAHPYNPGNPLGYSPTLTYQAQYDPNDPFREITLNADGSLNKTAAGGDNWFLNFDSTEGPIDTIWAAGTSYSAVPTDGNDAIFGDLGNDWLVGGTGRDTLYGGWGNDYLNADDVLNTGGSVANVGTDTNPSYEDVAYGGAGRDVLVANTGGDRLIDWIGEYNSYLTPFAPFGMATVSRTVQPQLPEYLDMLSASDGADPFLAAHYGSDPTRNGEPYGELGVVLQHDSAWGDQKGKPRDPQAGNSPGVQRDVLRSAGTKPINSPGTDPPAAPAATTLVAPTPQMAAYVGNNDVASAPIVIVGPIGASVSWTISDGVHSVSGTGTIGLDGTLSATPDLTGLANGTLTVTATVSIAGHSSSPGTTTTTKDTVLPGSVGVALPGYVGSAGAATTQVVLNGDPGNYVEYSIYGPGGEIDDMGYLDALGHLVVTFDLTGYTDGIYTIVATQYNEAFNASAIEVAPYQLTLDTVAPTGSFTVNNAASNSAITNNPTVSLQLSFGDDRSGVYLMQYTTDGGQHWSAWQPYASTLTATLPSPDGTYSVAVQVADRAGNTFLAIQHVILDRTGPTVAATLPAPTSGGTGYDVGAPLVLSWTATDLNGVVSSSASSEGQTISASGGAIDVDVLTAGTHTISISAKDRAGNVTTILLTFVLVPTAQGIRNAVVDGAARGWITASYESTLLTQIDQVLKANTSANVRAKLRQLVTTLQYPPAGAITGFYQGLLLNWTNDLLART
jgi:Ca2+-binding RTX toxin-like protein